MFDLKRLSDILEIRFHLEYRLAERAVQAVTPEQVRQLYEILDRMRVAAEAGKYSAEDDRTFHQTLWENIDNTMVRKILNVFWMIFRQAQERGSIPEPLAPLNTYKRHRAIVVALEKRDIESLRAAVTRHYTQGAGYWPWHQGYSNKKLTPGE